MPAGAAEWKAYCRDLDQVIPDNRATLLNDGREAFPAMLDAIRSATGRVLLEMYTFTDDRTGNLFREALEQRARTGVPVYVIYDSVGCIGTPHAFFNSMMDAGVKVLGYHPLAPWKPLWNWFQRDHRKLLIADGRAFVGGMNISDESAPHSEGGKEWRDNVVELDGPCLKNLETLFWGTWRECKGTVPNNLPAVFPGLEGQTPVRILTAVGLQSQNSIRRSYLNAIDHAKASICITSAYFLPGRSVYRRLIKAAQRGVKVRILLPYETDHPYVRWAGRALYGVFMENGVELYEYQKRLLHAKTAVIDGIWSTVGSHNLDHRSLRYNLELNVTIFGREFGGQLLSTFEKDLEGAKQLDLKTWRERPLYSKLAEEILYQLRYSL